MNKKLKLWGVTQCLFASDNTEMHRIEAKKGGYCSKHKHNAKYNDFYIESGRLLLKTWDGDTLKAEMLEAGQKATIAPGVLHQFVADTDTVAYEIYYTKLSDDIVRMSVGGVL